MRKVFIVLLIVLTLGFSVYFISSIKERLYSNNTGGLEATPTTTPLQTSTYDSGLHSITASSNIHSIKVEILQPSIFERELEKAGFWDSRGINTTIASVDKKKARGGEKIDKFEITNSSNTVRSLSIVLNPYIKLEERFSKQFANQIFPESQPALIVDIIEIDNKKGGADIAFSFYLSQEVLESERLDELEKKLNIDLFKNIWIKLHPEYDPKKNSDEISIQNFTNSILMQVPNSTFLQIEANTKQ